MKRFTSLMLMLLVAVTTWAQITVGSVYSIQNKNTGNAIKQNVNNELATVEANTSDNAQLWIVEQGSEGTYMLRNLASGRYAQYVNEYYTHWYTDYVTTGFYVGETEAATAEAPAYYYISLSAIADVKTASHSVMHQSNGYVVRWEQTNNSSQWNFVEVENVDVATISNEWKNMTTTKASAVAEIEALAKLNVLFPESAAFVERINAVTATGSDNSDLVDAGNRIKAIVTEYKQNAAGKNIKLCNKSADGRGGKYLGYDNTNKRAAAVASSGDDVIWTIKSNADGTFKLYNFVNDLYLGTPADPTPTVAKEADAPSFTIIPTDENVIAVVATTGQMVHVANHSNYKLISYYSLTDAASLWGVTAVPAIVATHDDIAAANAAKATLPYAIQQAYGLVTDANNYFSNYKSTAEGSYEALLDNVETTYFHSAYGEEPGDGTGVHYIQADLGEGNTVGAFYFYMKPRSGNGNNRPVDIIVEGSNDNATYNKIAEVETTLNSSMTPYLSPVCGDDMEKYRYIRLTVTSTNSGTKFFTLSELYFFPATEDVKRLANAYTNFASTSITSNDYANYANTLINAETTLALANIKKEIAALISANENNHATTPALGQYTTAEYNALVAAYNADDATQESLEAAIAAFNKSRNVPVYFIRSAHNGYAAGSAIYYDGAWKWKAANKYDKQMWMTIPAYAQENVPVVDAYNSEGTSYEICDYLTGTVMRGKSVQIVKIDGLDNAYNLQYNADANSTDAAQHAKDNGQLVNWKPGTANDALASAWYVDYLGTSYELDKLTDDKIAALAALQAAYNAKAFYAGAEMGDGLGQYKGNKEAIVTALAAAEVIGSKTLAQQATLNIADINAATEALNNAAALVINMPAAGKYYRIQGACEAAEGYENFYITGHTNADGGRIALTKEADASTIYYFDGTNLIAYESGLVIGLNNAHWTFASIDDNSKPASTITFAQSPRTAGAYTVKSADRYLHYFYYSVNNTVQVNRCENDVCYEHDWYLTEVTELPVTVTAAGYATFYAPVAVEVPAGVTAHTVTINGEWATLSDALTVVPANTGVVLVGEGSYDFAVTTADAFEGTNLMAGTVAKTLVTKAANTECYVLANGKEGVGLYAAVKGEDATKFYNAGHKAYLAVKGAEGIASYSFRFGEGTTGVENVVVENDVKAIYDLTGRRVENISAPGIYIVNGVKKLVR